MRLMRPARLPTGAIEAGAMFMVSHGSRSDTTNPSASGTSLYSNTEPLERSNPNFQESFEGFVQPAMRGNVDNCSISTARHKDAINVLTYR